jgi:hypothetical protein
VTQGYAAGITGREFGENVGEAVWAWNQKAAVAGPFLKGCQSSDNMGYSSLKKGCQLGLKTFLLVKKPTCL